MTFGIGRLFKSTDVGAPQFTGANGTLLAVLRAVLVDGYGSTPSLGWTQEYLSGNVGVFRMKGGTRSFIRLDDTLLATHTGTRAVDICGYSAMSTINVGIERTPPIGFVTPFKVRTFTTTAVNQPWMIIGDDAGFYFIGRQNYTSVNDIGIYYIQYIGDYNPLDVRNSWNFMISADFAVDPVHNGYASIFNPSYGAPAATSNMWAKRSCTFAKGAVRVGLKGMGSVFGYNFGVSSSLLSYKVNDYWMTSPVRVYEYYSVTDVLLGSMPGLFELVAAYASAAPVTVGTMPYTGGVPLPYAESTDSLGNKSILIVGYQLYAHYVNQNQLNKLVFKLGEGFRNVQ